MTELTLDETLRRLDAMANAKLGDPMPEFLSDADNNWAVALSELCARAAWLIRSDIADIAIILADGMPKDFAIGAQGQLNLPNGLAQLAAETLYAAGLRQLQQHRAPATIDDVPSCGQEKPR